MSIFNQSDRPGGRDPRSSTLIGGTLILVVLLAGVAQTHAQKDWTLYQPFGSALLWSVASTPDRTGFVAVGPERQVAWDGNLSVLEDRTAEELAGAYCVVLNGMSTVVGQILQEGIVHSGDRLAWDRALRGESFWGGAHGNGRFVIVGTGGRIATASDLLDDWTSVVVEGISTNLYAVCFAEGRFLTGNEGKIWTSPDGLTWERHDGGFSGSARSMVFGRDRYVMVGGGGSVRTSDDGLVWTARESGTTASLRSVTFGDGIFAAVGDRGTVIYSIDQGDTWDLAEVGTAQQLNSIAFGEGMFHAISSAGHVMTSRSIMTPPVIVSDLADQEVLSGSNVILEVSASGTAPLSYAWSFQGTTIEGASTSRLALSEVTEAVGGRYQVTVFNQAGAVTGRSALLRILPVDQPPAILVQPISVAGTEGERIELVVDAIGSAPLAFAWFKGSRLLSDHDGPHLVLDPAASGDSGRYSVVVSNRFGETRSQEVVVSIEPEDRVPEILQSPAGAELFAGQAFELRVSVRGWPPPSYQWFHDELAMPGQNGSTLRFAPVSMEDAGSYRVRISNRLASVDSDPALLSVRRPLSPPRIVVHPEDRVLTAGGFLHLEAAAEGHPEPGLQWYRNEEPLTGSTGRDLEIGPVGEDDAGEYWVRASNELGTVVSRRAVIVVGNGLPRVRAEPSSGAIEFGSRLELSVTADGPGPLTYRWFLDGTELTGQTGSQWIVAEAGFGDSGRYEAEISNHFGTVRTSAVQITVLPQDFTGVWMGEIDGADRAGRFALFVRDDGSAVLLADAGESGAIRDRHLRVGSDGAFGFDGRDDPASSPDPAPPGGSGRLRKDEVIGLTTDGGLLRGVRAAAEPVAPAGGYFRAGLAGTVSGELLLIADGAGRFVLTLETGEWFGAATGALDPSGRADLVLETGELHLRLDRESRILSGTWVPTGGAPLALGGRAEGAGGPGSLRNTSLRGVSGRESAVMVTGFVLEGTGATSVLLRGIGPGLNAFGVSGALASVKQRLFHGGNPLVESGSWRDSPEADRIGIWSTRAGAFPLDPDLDDSALAVDLEPGAYTVHLASLAGSGVGLTEIYLVPDPESPAAAGHLSNLSTRMRIGPGDEVVIVGFVISGDVPSRVLLRGVGPGLAPFGLKDVLADPRLELFREGSETARNDDWDAPGGKGIPAGLFEQVGAFPLAEGSRDAALVLWLEPGVYTAKVRSGDNRAGLVLAEIYAIP